MRTLTTLSWTARGSSGCVGKREKEKEKREAFVFLFSTSLEHARSLAHPSFNPDPATSSSN